MPGYVRTSSGAWKPVYDLQVQDGQSWRRAQRAYVVGEDGAWHLFHQFVETIYPAISCSVSTTQVDGGGSVTISGVVTDSKSKTPVGAGLSVSVYAGITRLTIVQTDSNGAWSYTWKPTFVGDWDVYATMPEQTPYKAAESNHRNVRVVGTPSLSVNWPAYGVIGVPMTFSGTSSSNMPTQQIASGVSVRGAIDGSGMPTTGTISSSGAWSFSWAPRPGDLGNNVFAVSTDPSSSPYWDWSGNVGKTLRVYQPTPSKPVQSVYSITNTSVRIKITDQANISHFMSRCIETGNYVRVESTGVAGAAVYANWSLAQDSTYHFTITAYSDNPVDSDVAGNTITVNTGHAATTDSGSATLSWDCTSSGSWRSIDGWSNLGSKLGQGYYSTGSPYYGVAAFNSDAIIRSINTYGGGNQPNRYNNVSVSELEVYLDRVSGSGSGSGVSVDFYCADNTPGSGTPTLGNSALGRITGPAPGSHAWYTLPKSVNSWLFPIMRNGWSLVMYANNSSQYSIYYGLSNFKLRATLTWNYNPIAYKAPTYSNG